jgi:hypothetical protein
VLRWGRSEPAEEPPSNRCWGHGWVNVLSFGHVAVLGPATHIFDYGEGGADAAGNGSSAFPEVVRCPLETGGHGGVDCEEGKREPSGNGGRGPPIGGGLRR